MTRHVLTRMANPREKHGPCSVHARSSEELPKWRSHVSVHARISGEGAENMGRTLHVEKPAVESAGLWIREIRAHGEICWKLIWIIIILDIFRQE